MKSKITFPSAGTETKYVWDKYSIHNNGEHVWGKYHTRYYNKYNWEQYSVIEKNSYTWKKYEAIEEYTYDWNRHTTNGTTDYVWNYWDTTTDYIYLISDDGPITITNNQGTSLEHSGNYYYHFYFTDGTTKSLKCADIISNNFIIDGYFSKASYKSCLQALGCYAVSVTNNDPTPPYPQYLTGLSTRLLIENNNAVLGPVSRQINGNVVRTSYTNDGEYTYRLFTYLNDYLVDTYISTDKNAYQNLLLDSQFRYYELQNDGFWNTDTEGRTVNWEDYIVLSSTNRNAYPAGFDGEYYYEYVGEEYTYKPGTYIEDVVGTSLSDYPDNGYKDGYYYVLQIDYRHKWDRYSIVEKPVWEVYNAIPDESIQVDYYDISNTNPYDIASHTDLGTLIEVPHDRVHLMNINGNENITLYGLNGGVDHYSGSVDKVSMTFADFINILNNIPEQYKTGPHHGSGSSDGYAPFEGIRGVDICSLCFIVGLSFNGNTYLFRDGGDWNPGGGTSLYLKQNADNTYDLLIDFEYYGWYFDTSDALDREKGTIFYHTFTSYDPPPGYEYVYDVPGLSLPNSSRLTRNITLLKSDQPNLFGRLVYNKQNMLPFSMLQYQREGVIYEGDYKLISGPTVGNSYLQGDTLLGTVVGGDGISYPSDGYKDGYWYVYIGNQSFADEFVDEIDSANRNQYPDDNILGNYWYKYTGQYPDSIIKGDYIKDVVAYDRYDYPDNGYYNGFWYVYIDYDVITDKGDYITDVRDISYYTYPQNGQKDNFWYVYNRYIEEGPFKGHYIQQVESNARNSYPDDGIMNGYWYDYNKSYTGYKLQIYDNQTQGGITYNHNVNPQSDFTIGNVACAEVEFKYFNVDDDIQKYLDCEYFQYYTWQENDNDWRLIGTFWIDDCKYNRNIATIKAYDELIKSEQFVDEFIAQTQFPVSINTFYTSLLEYLGLSGYINGVLPNDYLVYDNFEATNITGRQLLQYIAEAVGGYIKVDQNGRVIVDRYQGVKQYLDNTKYVSYDASKFTTKKIDGLIVKKTDDDVGVVSGESEGNVYIIKNNPLFYTDSTGEIQQQVNLIRSEIRDITYTPAKLKLLQDYNIQCGDIIEVNGNKFYVMSKKMTKSGVELECFGNQQREKKESPINADIVALRGKTNELVRDLESTKSTITDINSGLQSQITQTVESIETRITNEVEGLESKITQQAGSITSSVENQISQAKSEIKQTTDNISLSVQQQGNLVAQLSLDVDGILAKGYVTFTDLSGSGKTTINGDNITTGSISADRINLTGSINWNDLTQSCKNTIASYAGQDGSDAYVPDYIKNTYIDSVRIVSPTISGGIITAGTTAEGYITMASSGMNFASPEKNLIGLGFYPGKYEYPYIILGDGVDSIGTDRGMIKKYEYGMWIGDNDNQNNDQPGGTGIFINFVDKKIYKYIDGVATEI